MNKIPGIKGAEFSEPVMRAYYFASAAHGAVRQVRKYTAEPYINHPVEVLGILSSYCGEKVTDCMRQAASCAYPSATGPALLLAATAVCSWSVLFWTSPIKFTWGGS